MKTLSKIYSILLAITLLLSATNSYAESMSGKSKYSLGFQTGFETCGISGKMDLSDKMAVQGIIGFFGTMTNFSGRGLYKFKSEEYWDLYGYGQAGIWMWDGGYVGSETAFGIGGGAGIEWDWRAINKDLPPVYWSIELGLTAVSMDYYDFAMLGLGFGGHYRF